MKGTKNTVEVLILVVVDNGLVRFFFVCGDTVGYVLILIVVDNGLVQVNVK